MKNLKEKSIFEIIEGKTFDEVKEIVTNEPFFMKMDETEDYYLIKYDLINSNMDYKACNQCRGIIFRKDNNKLVCYPFDKFYNHQSSRAAKIDWSTARVQEKLDGSLIKIWKDEGVVHVSTNGKINAEDAFTQNKEYNFKELVLKAVNQAKIDGLFAGTITDDSTFMFELTTPFNRVVVPHNTCKLKCIGIRHNPSKYELDPLSPIDFEYPIDYNLVMGRTMDLSEVIEAAATMSFDQEGFVVCDANFNRIKIKSLGYLAVHKIRGNGKVNEISVLDLVRKNDHREFLLYFPEYQEDFDNIKELYYDWKERVLSLLSEVVDKFNLSQKEFAEWALKQINSSVLFIFYKKRSIDSFNSWFESIKTKKLLNLIKEKK